VSERKPRFFEISGFLEKKLRQLEFFWTFVANIFKKST